MFNHFRCETDYVKNLLVKSQARSGSSMNNVCNVCYVSVRAVCSKIIPYDMQIAHLWFSQIIQVLVETRLIFKYAGTRT